MKNFNKLIVFQGVYHVHERNTANISESLLNFPSISSVFGSKIDFETINMTFRVYVIISGRKEELVDVNQVQKISIEFWVS